MGSVIDYNDECPRCKNTNCFDDYYYKTGEEYFMCPDCGYYRAFHYKRDENGEYLKKDELKGYEFDNLIEEEILIDNPYGVYIVESSSGGGSMGVLEMEKDYEELKSKITSEKVTVSRLVGDKIEKEKL